MGSDKQSDKLRAALVVENFAFSTSFHDAEEAKDTYHREACADLGGNCSMPVYHVNAPLCDQGGWKLMSLEIGTMFSQFCVSDK